MSLNFELKSIGEKSDMFLVLSLIRYTESGNIKWIESYNDNRIARFHSSIDIEGVTQKKISVEYFINRILPRYSYLIFHLQKTLPSIHKNKIREIKGQSVMSLLKYIKKLGGK